jgi:hypothetical protein
MPQLLVARRDSVRLRVMQKVLFGFCLALSLSVFGTELKFDFSRYDLDKSPTNFTSVVAGRGKPGDWKVIMDDVPPALAPFSQLAPVVSRRAVLAQLSREPIDEHFPILVYDGDTFGDFTMTTKFKTVGGGLEQMAGIVFRLQDEKNFYVLRASSLGSTFRFYKVVDGVRSDPIGTTIQIPNGEWHEMSVECKGSKITCALDGKAFPTMDDTSFKEGKVGFWTKSDSVSFFYDTKITFIPKIVPAQSIVDSTLETYSRLVGLKVYATTVDPNEARIIASKDKQEIGQSGSKDELDCLQRGTVLWAKGVENVEVLMPLRDQNGEPVAAVRIVMKTFTGQTEQNALQRALPIIQTMQKRVQTKADVVQ